MPDTTYTSSAVRERETELAEARAAVAELEQSDAIAANRLAALDALPEIALDEQLEISNATRRRRRIAGELSAARAGAKDAERALDAAKVEALVAERDQLDVQATGADDRIYRLLVEAEKRLVAEVTGGRDLISRANAIDAEIVSLGGEPSPFAKVAFRGQTWPAIDPSRPFVSAMEIAGAVARRERVRAEAEFVAERERAAREASAERSPRERAEAEVAELELLCGRVVGRDALVARRARELAGKPAEGSTIFRGLDLVASITPLAPEPPSEATNAEPALTEQGAPAWDAPMAQAVGDDEPLRDDECRVYLDDMEVPRD